MKKSSTNNQFTNWVMAKFSSTIISVIQYQESMLTFNRTKSDKLLLIFNNEFSFSKFSVELETNKEALNYFLKNSPYIFTEDEIKNSCDIFPIEFYEMLESEQVIFGKTLGNYIKISDENLRLQVESNLRRNLIILRQKYFKNRKALPELLFASLNNLILALKNILRLQNSLPEKPNVRDIILKIVENTDIDVHVFFDIIRYFENPKEEKKRFKKDRWLDLALLYFKQLEIIIKEVDQLDV